MKKLKELEKKYYKKQEKAIQEKEYLGFIVSTQILE